MAKAGRGTSDTAPKSGVFRPYSSSQSLGSDRSSGDRLRHRDKVREAIRESIADIVAEESIIGRSGDTIVKVPIRGIKEYRFVYGRQNPGVAQGDGDSEPGQVVGRGQPGDGAPGGPGDQPGVDYYETDISLEELIDLMFEDLELPDMERKALRQVVSHRATRRKGYRKVGIRVQLDKRQSAKMRVRRRIGTGHADNGVAGFDPGQGRFPFHRDDLRFRRRKPDIAFESNAVVICIMDTSGSMDTQKKYLARSFFFLLYHFVRSRYEHSELVFVAHDAKAREVGEDDFFHKGEAGGTMISSGYSKALEIINERYHPSLWNVYAFHCSDGDNFDFDNAAAIRLARELCDSCNLFGYGEIKPPGGWSSGSSMLERLAGVGADNFQAVSIKGKEDVWPGFKSLLSKEPKNES